MPGEAALHLNQSLAGTTENLAEGPSPEGNIQTFNTQDMFLVHMKNTGAAAAGGLPAAWLNWETECCYSNYSDHVAGPALSTC